MTQVYLASSAKDVLNRVDAAERKGLVDDLQALPNVPAPNVTKVEIEGQQYEAAAVSDEWVAIYRDLKPEETPTHRHERAIAVMDLLSTAEDTAADPSS
jgi:hypothetical protein